MNRKINFMENTNIKNIRNLIRSIITEELDIKTKRAFSEDPNKDGVFDEERITNPAAKSHVKKRQNFIGSHIFGEDLGDLGKMYVAYSYGEHFPVYLYYNGKWYHNYDDYTLEDGSVNGATEKHKRNMMPTKDTIGISKKQMQELIHSFKRKNGIKEIDHTSVEVGEKN